MEGMLDREGIQLTGTLVVLHQNEVILKVIKVMIEEVKEKEKKDTMNTDTVVVQVVTVVVQVVTVEVQVATVATVGAVAVHHT